MFSESVRKRLFRLFVVLFLAWFATGFTAGVTAGICRDVSLGDDLRRYACSVSVNTGFVFPGSSAKRAFLYQERGILRAGQGREEEAVADFRQAITDAAKGRPDLMYRRLVRPTHWHHKLLIRISLEPEDSPALPLWDRAERELTPPF